MTPMAPTINATPLPGATATGTVRWTILSTYLPPGATTPVAAPAKGKVTFTPKLDLMNLDGDVQATMVNTPTVVDLDENGHLEVQLIADDGAKAQGWDYEVSTALTVIKPDGSGYVAATGTITQKFGVHVNPGDDLDLDDVRPIGKNASTGQLVAQGKPGVSLTGEIVQNGTTVQLRLSDGSLSEPITLPVLTADGGTIETTPVDSSPFTISN